MESEKKRRKKEGKGWNCERGNNENVAIRQSSLAQKKIFLTF